MITRRLWAGALALTACSAAALAAGGPASARAPRNGCWVGRHQPCGGDLGPVHGVLTVSDGKVTGVYDELACLGSGLARLPAGGRIRLNHEVTLDKAVSIHRDGAFSFHGRAQRTTRGRSSSGLVSRPVRVGMSGRFTRGGRIVKLSLDVHYGACRTTTLTLHRVGG